MMKKKLHNDRNYPPSGKTEICLFIFLFLAFLAFGMTPNGISASAENPAVCLSGCHMETDYTTPDGDTYRIALDYGPEAKIPAGSVLKAREILEGEEGYEQFLSESASSLGVGNGGISFARFFDIEIESNGEKIEPEAPVQVTIAYRDPLALSEGEKLSIVHFADSGTEIISNLSVRNDNTEIVYKQASFSVTATIITGTPDPGQVVNISGFRRYYGTPYAVIIQDETTGIYYQVQNDGRLTEVTVNEEGNVSNVSLKYPLMWNYASSSDGLNDDTKNEVDPDNVHPNSEPYNLRITHDARGYDGNELPEGYYFRYISAQSANGIDEEDENNPSHSEKKYYNGLSYVDHKLVSQSCDSNGSNCTQNYYIGADFTTLHITGQNSEDDVANIKIFLAAISENDIPSRWSSNNETVSHIDIGVDAVARFDLPLGYGTYYYEDGRTAFIVSSDNPRTLVLEKDIVVGEKEIMKAEVEAIDKDGNEIPNAFYITGYSSNQETVLDPVQVRVDGIYKVDQLGIYQGSGRSNDNGDRKEARLKNQIYYRVSIVKDTVYYLMDSDGIQRTDEDGNLIKVFKYDTDNKSEIEINDYHLLYDENGQPLTVNVKVRIADVFSYWDEHNECPPLEDTFEQEYYWLYECHPEIQPWNNPARSCQSREELERFLPDFVKRNYNNWQSGAIIDNDWGGNPTYIGDSGMDFRLGYKQDSRAIEMSKIIQDENGHRLQPNRDISNELDIYFSDPNNQGHDYPDRVMNIAVSPNSIPSGQIGTTDYSYNLARKNWNVVNGADGVGVTYLYNMPAGMYYVAEDPALLAEGGVNHLIVDTTGKTWVYKDTRIETEYVWRDNENTDKRHVAIGTSAVPEALGEYTYTKEGNEISTYWDEKAGENKPLNNGFLEFFVYNIYEEALIDLELTKTWDDGSDADGLRPAPADYKAKLHLLADRTDVTSAYADKITVTDNGDNTFTVKVSGLPQYYAGTEIVYTMTEDEIAKYTTDTDDPQKDGGRWTNSHTPEETEITVTKIWNDENDQKKIRPTAAEYKAKLHLRANGTDVTGTYADKIEVTDNGDNTFTVTVSGLPKNAAGNPIVYTMTEAPINGYTPDTTRPQGNNGSWTNSYTKERERFTFFRLPHLPETGFSAVNAAVLPKQPKDLNYKPLRWKLEIPSISVEADIVGVPKVNDEYPVAWLGSSAGLLEGSSLPGQGQSYITGHNHLNTMEAGPFAMIKYLTEGDRIFVTDPGSRMQTFEVYRNSKISETDFDGLYRISDSDEYSLTLITCEDERPDGGYENRRIIAARPILRPDGE